MRTTFHSNCERKSEAVTTIRNVLITLERQQVTAIPCDNVSCRTQNRAFNYFVVLRITFHNLECVGNFDQLQETEEVFNRICCLGRGIAEFGGLAFPPTLLVFQSMSVLQPCPSALIQHNDTGRPSNRARRAKYSVS